MRLIRTVAERGLPAVAAVLGLIALVVELFGFNFPHWASLTAGEEIVVTADNAQLRGVVWNPDSGLFELTESHGQIELSGFDQKVSTIWIDPVFSQSKQRQVMKVHYDDEGASNRNTGSFDLVDSVERNQYVILSAMGHTTRVAVEFDSDQAIMGIRQIVLNQTVPLFFNLFRLIALWGGLVLVYLLLRRQTWRLRFDSTTTWQRVVNGCLVGAFIVTLAAAVVWSDPTDGFAGTLRRLFTSDSHQYTKLIDAMLQGQVSLLDVPDQSLLDAELPYDPTYRVQHGVNFQWDYAFFDGKYYSYFGIVPAILVYLPFRLITGQHLSTTVATWVAASTAAWFFYLVWRETVKRWFPRLPYLLYALGAAALLACSQLLFISARPVLFESVIATGAALIGFGVWCLLKATAKRELNLRWLGAGALGLALAVGCRPNLALLSALLPLLVWPALPRTRAGQGAAGGRHARGEATTVLDRHALWRPVLAVGLPYVVVAAGLMVYNGVRFGSVLEFGASYQLTVANVAGYMDRGLLGTLLVAAYGLLGYIGCTVYIRPLFPFITPDTPWYMPGFTGYIYTTRSLGAVFVPLLWLLAGGPLVKEGFQPRRPLGRLVVTAVVVGLAEAAAVAVLGGVVGRYEADFMWLWAWAALVVMALLYERGLRAKLSQGKLLAVCSALLLGTVFVVGQVGLMGESERLLTANPDIFYRLQNSLRFW
ncbi:MAG: hypothetical protein LBK42_07485 [Propionibacteriaceae bacterium]|nr:hypothetical protein [Propionibacteriaceae bacterium]